VKKREEKRTYKFKFIDHTKKINVGSLTLLIGSFAPHTIHNTALLYKG
jgi:hypothetical protein